MSLARQLTAASALFVACGAAVAFMMHFVYPELRENDANEEDHVTTVLLTITDAPHVFIAIATAVLRAAALDKNRKNFGGGALSSSDEKDGKETGAASSPSSSSLSLPHLTQTLVVALLSTVVGLILHSAGVDELYAPLTYFVVLHSIAQVVWTVQQSSVDEGLVYAALPHQRGFHAQQSGGGWSAAVNAQHYWWAPAVLRPRGFDAAIALVMLACPVAVWLMDADRGLDWFHWELAHSVSLPRALLPVVSMLYVMGLLVQLVRFCSVSAMELPLHLMPPAVWGRSGGGGRHLFAPHQAQYDGAVGSGALEDGGDAMPAASALSPTSVVPPQLGMLPQGAGPLAHFLPGISTPVLGLVTATAACVAFSVGVLVPDRDISVPLLAIPHTGVSIAACLCVVHRCARILWPGRSPMAAVGTVMALGLAWGVLDHLIVDAYVNEPHALASFVAYALPQILHLALDPSRSAWFLHSDERFALSAMD